MKQQKSTRNHWQTNTRMLTFEPRQAHDAEKQHFEPG